LEDGQLAGACLDVFENEKPKTFTPSEVALYERLYKMENVVLSPHVAGWTHESKRRLAEVLLSKILECDEVV
jgi:D-3-phosphoglycerate dehydrogenase